jgi:hypothetical protein
VPRRAIAALAVALLGFAASPGVARAEDEPRNAADVTAVGRSLDGALDQILGRSPREPGRRRALVFLVDATRALQDAGFRDRLEQAFDRKSAALADVSVGLGLVGAKGALVVPPAPDRAPLLAELGKALASAPAAPVRNVYADVRALAGSAAFQGAADREIVLVTLDNGDVEDDLEATVEALGRAKATCSVIAREAFLADSYSLSHSFSLTPPRGTTWTSGDGAWASVPWGWLFQQQVGHEAAPSGFATFGLSRLAAATGGRVHLYAAPGGKHDCSGIANCPFCNDDHDPPGEVYERHRLEALAPSVAERSRVLAADAKDPWLRATLDVWAKAAKAGLVRSRPTASPRGESLEIEKRVRVDSPLLSGNSAGFRSLAGQAAQVRAAGEKLVAEFEDDLARIDPQSGSARHRAAAETTRVMLHLTVMNVVLFERFCEDVAPVVCAKDGGAVQPPEVPVVADGSKVTGFGYTSDCLCHGVAPFRHRRLGGGADFAARLDALEKLLDGFFQRYDHTPWGVAVRRSGFAHFMPTIRGKYVPPPDRKGASSETDGGATTPTRPDRGGGDSGGSGGGGASTPGGK